MRRKIISNEVSVYCGKMFSYHNSFSHFHYIQIELKIRNMEVLKQFVFHSRLKKEKLQKGLFKYHCVVTNELNVFMVEGNNSFITKEFYGE